MIPKYPTLNGSCVLIIIVGSNRCTAIGKRYQFNRLKAAMVLLWVSVICWQSSDANNTKPNTHMPKKIDLHIIAASIASCDYENESIRIRISIKPSCLILDTNANILN